MSKRPGWDDHPELVRERDQRIAEHLERKPRWWQRVARRRWKRQLRSLQAMSVSQWTMHLRQLYPATLMTDLAAQQRNPLLALLAKYPKEKP